MFAYEFMVNAFAAATVVAVVAGAVGSILVLRGQSFAGHALSHIGFTGATGALLVGLSPLAGLVLMTVAGGMGMGLLGERAAERDVAIGVVLAVSLGAGLLFLHLFTTNAAEATALLFGDVLGVDADTIWALAALAVLALLGLAAIARPLLFTTLQPEVAAARGVPVRTVSVLFMAVAGLTVAMCVPVVGVLLVFSLLVAPAATAQRLCSGVGWATGAAVLLALAEAWGGLVLAYVTDWPAGFWITALGAGLYGAAVLIRR